MRDFEKYAAKERLTKLASEAASSYLEYDTSLNSTIKKLAHYESLSTEEVCRVCEESNQQVYASLFTKLADKTFTFPLADACQVLDGINKNAGASTVDTNYRAVDIVDEDPGQEKTAGYLGEMKITGDPDIVGTNRMQRLAIFLEKLSVMKANLEEDKVRGELIKEAAVDRFLHNVKQIVLRGESTFQNLYHNLVDARPDSFQKIATLLKMSSLQMGKKLELAAFEKIAGGKVSEELFKRGLSFSGRPLKVINGRQVLVASLDTLVRQDLEYDTLQKGLSHIGDKVKYVRKELHNFVASEMQKDT